MNEEEKKLINNIERALNLSEVKGDLVTIIYNYIVKATINLINKLQEIIEKQSYTNKKLRNKIKTVRKERNKLQKELDKKDKVIRELESKLEKHIKFCEQESRGHLENKVCHISLKFEKKLLEEIKKVEEENETN